MQPLDRLLGGAYVRTIIYGALVVFATYAAFAIYNAWPKAPAADISLIDQGGHRRLAELRALARASPTPRSFVAPKPFSRPALPDSVSSLEQLAAHGNADAQCKLGIKFEHGEGVAEDAGAARKWYIGGSTRHNPCAINGLGNLYETGAGVPRDTIAALAYYRAAANLGYAGASYNLGLCYENGWGVQPNDRTAFSWYRKAADAGYENAFVPVADYYENGRGGIADSFLAEQYFALAAKTGDAYAMESLALLYVNDPSVPHHYDRALQLLKTDKQSAWSDFMIGWMYQTGAGVKKSNAVAARWYATAAQQHYGPAETAYAAMLHLGTASGKRDDAGAVRYFSAAARDGDAQGMYLLGTMAQAGEGMPKNASLAEHLYAAAAALGEPDALMLIAYRYNNGVHGYPRDRERAAALAAVAVTRGASPQQAMIIAPPRSNGVDPERVMQLIAEYRHQIDELTGREPINGPAAGMPRVPLTTQT